MKKFLKTFFIFAALLAAGCSEKGLDLSGEDESGNETVSHEMIVLGKKLDDPYSVSNVTKALASLYPTKAGRVDVTPTDIYVRFLPKTEEEYQKLVTLGYELMDHPFLTLAMIHPTCLHLCTKLLSKARKGDAIHPEKSALFTIY